MKKIMAIALSLALAFSLAACGGDSSSASAPAAGSAGSGSAASTAGGAKQYKIAYAFANMDENNMRTLTGLNKAIDEMNATGEYDIELIYTDSQSQVDKQISDVESLIQQQPDLILVSAVDTVGSIPCLEAVKAAGIIAVDDRGMDSDAKDLKLSLIHISRPKTKWSWGWSR